jgi:hypothetical protein
MRYRSPNIINITDIKKPQAVKQLEANNKFMGAF